MRYNFLKIQKPVELFNKKKLETAPLFCKNYYNLSQNFKSGKKLELQAQKLDITSQTSSKQKLCGPSDTINSKDLLIYIIQNLVFKQNQKSAEPKDLNYSAEGRKGLKNAGVALKKIFRDMKKPQVQSLQKNIGSSNKTFKVLSYAPKAALFSKNAGRSAEPLNFEQELFYFLSHNGSEAQLEKIPTLLSIGISSSGSAGNQLYTLSAEPQNKIIQKKQNFYSTSNLVFGQQNLKEVGRKSAIKKTNFLYKPEAGYWLLPLIGLFTYVKSNYVFETTTSFNGTLPTITERVTNEAFSISADSILKSGSVDRKNISLDNIKQNLNIAGGRNIHKNKLKQSYLVNGACGTDTVLSKLGDFYYSPGLKNNFELPYLSASAAESAKPINSTNLTSYKKTSGFFISSANKNLKKTYFPAGGRIEKSSSALGDYKNTNFGTKTTLFPSCFTAPEKNKISFSLKISDYNVDSAQSMGQTPIIKNLFISYMADKNPSIKSLQTILIKLDPVTYGNKKTEVFSPYTSLPHVFNLHSAVGRLYLKNNQNYSAQNTKLDNSSVIPAGLTEQINRITPIMSYKKITLLLENFRKNLNWQLVPQGNQDYVLVADGQQVYNQNTFNSYLWTGNPPFLGTKTTLNKGISDPLQESFQFKRLGQYKTKLESTNYPENILISGEGLNLANLQRPTDPNKIYRSAIKQGVNFTFLSTGFSSKLGFDYPSTQRSAEYQQLNVLSLYNLKETNGKAVAPNILTNFDSKKAQIITSSYISIYKPDYLPKHNLAGGQEGTNAQKVKSFPEKSFISENKAFFHSSNFSYGKLNATISAVGRIKDFNIAGGPLLTGDYYRNNNNQKQHKVSDQEQVEKGILQQSFNSTQGTPFAWNFNRFMEYLKLNLNKYIILDKYYTKTILQNYLPKSKQTLKKAERYWEPKTKTNSNFLNGPELNNFKKIGSDSRNSAGGRLLFRSSSPGGAIQIQNFGVAELPIVLKHQKFFVGLKKSSKKSSAFLESVLVNKNQNTVGLDGSEINQYSNSPKTFDLSNPKAEAAKPILETKHKHYNQKKRRAKKQKLETRRKKKRKRFYPRPTWLRLRLGMQFYKFKKQTYLSDPYILEKTYKKTTQFTSQNSKFRNLNNYLETLKTNTTMAYGHKKSLFGSAEKSLTLPLKVQKNLTNPKNSLKNLENNLIYDHIVYNLWLSGKNKINWIFLQPKVVSQKSSAFFEEQKSLFNNQVYQRDSNLAGGQEFKKISKFKPEGDSFPGGQNADGSFFNRRPMLTSIKLNSSYAPFEEKSPQNQQKKESNPNSFRNFWIWLYNLTNTNQVNKQIYINNFLKYLQIPISSAYPKTDGPEQDKSYSLWLDGSTSNKAFSSYGEDIADKASEGSKQHLDKTKPHLNSFGYTGRRGTTNNFYELAQRSSSIGSQNAKNIKTNFNSNLSKRISWSLNKTNLWSTTNQLTGARVNFWSTQKLRNQSKNNQTKYLEKQLKKQFSNLFLNGYVKEFSRISGRQNGTDFVKDSSSFGSIPKSFLDKISKKLWAVTHQKEIKLKFLASSGNELVGGPSLNNNTSKPKALGLAQKTVGSGFLAKPSVAPGAQSNFNWWSDIQQLSLAQYNNQQFSAFSIPQSFGYADSFWLRRQTSYNASISNYAGGEMTIFAFLFHFCALISLISISQIRCFFKFHLILLYKLSNIYLKIIYKTHTFLKNVTLGGFSSPMAVGHKKSPGGDNFSFAKKLISEKNRNLASKLILQVYGLPSGSNRSFYAVENKVYAAAFMAYGHKKNLRGKFSKLSREQQKVSFLYNNVNNPKTLSTQGNLFAPGSIKQAKESILYSNKFSYSEGEQSNQNGAKFLKGQDKNKLSTTETRPGSMDSNFWLKKKSSYLIQFFIFFLSKQSGQVGKTLLANDTNSSSLPPSAAKLASKLPAPSGIWKQTFLSTDINKKSLKLYFIRENQEKINLIKKTTYNTSLKVVDTFESFLRVIYSFFEKPAELTMDWVAYAFLVEWSSDLLTYIPENKDKQNWTAFAKFARKSQFVLPLFYGTSSLTNQTTSGLLGSKFQTNLYKELVAPGAFGIPQFIAFNLFNTFIYKRILYLNDLFIEVLNRPDTDLITRQKKGTLFWDIWSDILIKAADRYNINIASLSNIKEEQNTLISAVGRDSFLDAPTAQEKIKSARIGKSNFNKVLTNLKTEYIDILFKADSKSLYKKGLALSNLQKTFLNSASGGQPRRGYTEKSRMPQGTYFSKAFGTNQQTSAYINQNDFFFSRKNFFGTTEFVTYQSKETELFLDYHPPKSFAHISSIQYYTLVQQPIGSLVCQIYSGILKKQISKNILVIGSTLNTKTSTLFERMQKTLLIQSLAGETEIPIITDNARKYAVVNRGFAVGIKLLKEVFEAISLNTPCLFLLEDIHLIGERRPLLISDHGDSGGDEMSKATEVAFGSQRNGDAIHEKNQVLYQFTRHGITHYQKPFKGDFSLSIPTNHFTFDLFLKTRSADFSSTPTSPLAYSINYNALSVDSSGQQNEKDAIAGGYKKIISSRTIGTNGAESSTGTGGDKTNVLSSSLQRTRNQLLSPPATSPFTVLLLKEQKKFKPKKIVSELPWFGLPTEQLALLPRVSYSVRAKVAALADLSFSNMSAKFDMITDLLVIIDSVRGNRGFVVFATTHLPHILDPALRRPGRLDETISIPTLSNIWNRWEFTKSPQPFVLNMAPQAKENNYGLKNNILPTLSPTSIISSLLPKALFLNLSYSSNNFLTYNGTLDYLDFLNLDFLPNQPVNIVSPIITNITNKIKNKTNSTRSRKKLITASPDCNFPLEGIQKPISLIELKSNNSNANFTKKPANCTIRNFSEINKTRNIAYYQMGRKLISNFSQILNTSSNKPFVDKPIPFEQNTINKSKLRNWSLFNFNPLYNNIKTSDSTTLLTETKAFLTNEIQYKTLYSSAEPSILIQKTLIGLISGKFSEFFATNNLPIPKTKVSQSSAEQNSLNGQNNSAVGRVHTWLAPENKSLVGAEKFNKNILLLNKNSISKGFLAGGLGSAGMTLYGIDETWRSAMSLVLSFIQKRYLYNPKLIVPKLLDFSNFSVLEEAPSPPTANLLIPAKRYENYKKVFKENICSENKLYFDSQSKVQSHTKQFSILLANYSNNLTAQKTNGQTTNHDWSEAVNIENRVKPEKLNNLLILDTNRTVLTQPTNIKWYYQNKIFKRHKNYLTNQWWNGQLIEHNAETLFLSFGSAGDWRYSFINSNATKTSNPSKKAQGLEAKKLNSAVGKTLETNAQQVQDVLLDFPDSEQFYNPKNRRWMLNSGYWSSWFDFNTKMQTDIMNHLILDSFIVSFNILNQNRELLDFSVSKFIEKGLIKEIQTLYLTKKFQY